MDRETGQAIVWALIVGIACGGGVIGALWFTREAAFTQLKATMRAVNEQHVKMAEEALADYARLHEQFMAVSAALETQARENTAQAAIIGKLRLDLDAAHRDLLMVTPEQLDKDRKGRK
jgi:hypothetical protein